MMESTANDAGLDMKGTLAIFGPENLSEAELLAVTLGRKASQNQAAVVRQRI